MTHWNAQMHMARSDPGCLSAEHGACPAYSAFPRHSRISYTVHALTLALTLFGCELASIEKQPSHRETTTHRCSGQTL